MTQYRFPAVFVFLLAALASVCKADTISSSNIDYLGETPPGNTPKVFASGWISKPDRWEGNAVFSPSGDEFFFNVFVDEEKSIYRMQRTEQGWSKPKPFAVLGEHNNWEPFMTADGQSFYYVSSRPPGSPEWNGRIWKSSKQNGHWSQPIYMDFGQETDKGYWFPNTSLSGNLYFGGTFPDVGNLGKGDGYVFDFESGTLTNIEAINTEHEEWDPYISPDERFILWASNRPGGYGDTDLYISFRKSSNGKWGDAVNLGPEINTTHYEVAPRLSPDGKYLFFDRPINGTQDIYWVSMENILLLQEEDAGIKK